MPRWFFKPEHDQGTVKEKPLRTFWNTVPDDVMKLLTWVSRVGSEPFCGARFCVISGAEGARPQRTREQVRKAGRGAMLALCKREITPDVDRRSRDQVLPGGGGKAANHRSDERIKSGYDAIRRIRTQVRHPRFSLGAIEVLGRDAFAAVQLGLPGCTTASAS